MDLPLIPDVAVKQVIDSTKAFKEYVRVRNELKALGGSVRWKNVDGYEYLVQSERHKLVYLGKRTAETERRHEEHSKKHKRLKERFKSLTEVVETSQRMNKAVRAGTAPTELIEVLLKLDELGLAERSVLLGASALYAYGQASGLCVEQIKTPVRRESVVAEAARCVHVLIEEPDSFASTSFHRLAEAMEKVACVDRAAVKRGNGTALDIVFHLLKNSKAKSISARTRHLPAPTLERPAEPWVDVIKASPKYEQVIIGKTGKMALMRTVDPCLFTAIFKWSSQQEPASPATQELLSSQIKLVETMLDEHMVNSKIAPAQRDLLAKQMIAPRAHSETSDH